VALASDNGKFPRHGAAPRPEGLYVVGIGASAGGLQALRTLFGAMPSSPNTAFVVVVHLSPDHESHLVPLLQPYTTMRVRQVTETVALEPNTVYVIPPNANLDTIDTHLRLSKLEERRIERAPIDHFLRTLAATHNGRAIGVVLTGGGSDGALGLRQIKERGGLTIVQQPNEAEHDGMPVAAIATGMVDLVLLLKDIPDAIERFRSTAPRLSLPEGDARADAAQRDVLEDILRELHQITGQELTVFTDAAVLSRIGRRMRLHQVDTLAAYLELLRSRRDESLALYDDLLVNVLEFFRDAKLFTQLETSILPELFERKSGVDDRVRAWSLGCSTGEEAYSLAILLAEEAARRERRVRLQVFASDLSERALRRGREGVYPPEVGATVSAERLERFFTAEPGAVRVRSEIRELVVFASHNLFRDPPFSHIDLIVCQTLLANLQPTVRRAIVELFRYALEPRGVLALGTDDQLDEPDLFECVDEGARLYRRRDTAGAYAAAAVPIPPLGGSPGRPFRPMPHAPLPDVAAIHDRFTARLAPESVLVDSADEVLHFSPRAGRFVRLPGGSPTRHLLELVPEPLCSRLRAALPLVRGDRRPWKSEPLEIERDGATQHVVLRVEPSPLADAPELLLVAFEELQAPRSDVPPHAPTAALDAVLTIAALEKELDDLQQRVRRILARQDSERDVRGHEAAAAEEDLQSTVEELRCILRELEASKQELQAANEELLALGTENRRRIDDLAQVSADFKHLLESTGIATLFLDFELRIVRYTPQVAELFNVRPPDRGRPLTDLTHGLRYDELESDAQRVLEHRSPSEREVEGPGGRWYLARFTPYRSRRDVVDGVVLSLIDVTERKEAVDKLRETDRRKDEFLALLAHELRNPLAPIAAGIEVLKIAAGDKRIVDQMTATMARQTQQLVRLVDDLLEVSRISGGRLRLQRTAVRVADLFRDAVAAVRPLIERGGHDLVVELPDEAIVLDADPARLAQVLGNLLNNAARYTPRGGRISFTAAREGDDAVIVVTDNGVGIAEDIRGRVFEMFFQADEARRGRHGGLGIGLTLAKSLVEMHGGSIAVASEGPGRGTEVTLRLPITAHATAERERPHGEARRDLSGHRVLIVDDNADAAQTLSVLVKTLGDNDVRTAMSGAEALETGAALEPDIVLLDLKMPEMDGYEVARRMRAEPWGAGMLLVALTGFGQDEHKRRTKEAGFDRHLTKPADRAAVEALLGESRRALQ
jgi:two-component system CheB/CheR fusion protein